MCGSVRDRKTSVAAKAPFLRIRAFYTMIIVASVVVLMLSGCGIPLFPSRPFGPEYVVNRDGHYFAGVRCSFGLTEIGVFMGDNHPVGSDDTTFDNASWHAVSQPSMVREFELFVSDQPGVTVVFDDGNREYSNRIVIEMRAGDDLWFSLLVTLDMIESGQVASWSGGASWDEYMKQSSASIGCG
jgi:hypothetical protein